jgi:hypothetical protein
MKWGLPKGAIDRALKSADAMALADRDGWTEMSISTGLVSIIVAAVLCSNAFGQSLPSREAPVKPAIRPVVGQGLDVCSQNPKLPQCQKTKRDARVKPIVIPAVRNFGTGVETGVPVR